MSERRLVLQDRIESRILMIRGLKVMLAADLAKLYGVSTKALNQAVARNAERFPGDFVFRLTWDEARQLAGGSRSRSQFVTLNSGAGHNVKYLPNAFTEQGVAMLSSVLRGKRAVAVNVEIMRVFVKLRTLLASNADLAKRLESLERKSDAQFKAVFDAIRAMMNKPDAVVGLDPGRERIGFDRKKAQARKRVNK